MLPVYRFNYALGIQNVQNFEIFERSSYENESKRFVQSIFEGMVKNKLKDANLVVFFILF